ncbi:NucA/NucB deoxyribonuclease domain-containing protein [Acidipropionibacterium acidipropionici]|uniref:NucA/NucB deoxyribonuclease domain-containing protein n=1 Tax=Acidipropionibacterium acidipropionici TaxID=1748 RepID=UPI00110B1E1E|nr:RHS repeat-associated core domain-containing protein [Acidipropionibacterium acidipropionici]QCV96302.1 hypothetical protein FEZ30_14480 [Acidipropionibacterium acidipropionici]
MRDCYAYDGLGRLGDAWTVKDACGATPTSASSSQVGGVVPMWRSWAFDAAGRRTSQTIHQIPGSSKPGQSTSYAAGAAGHAHATATATTLALDGSVPPAAGASQTVSYGYDAAGNTISVSGGGADQELSWDAAGRVSRVEAGAKASGYVYDAEGNLLIRTGAGGADSVLYAGDTEVHLSASGQVGGVRSYRFGDRTVAERSGQGLRALYTDQVGTGVASVDWADLSQVTWRMSDPYGNQLGLLKGPWPTDRGVMNLAADPVSGYVQTGARLYDPVAGRFISADPVLDQSDPLSLNGYGYTSADPVNFSDPSGQWSIRSVLRRATRAVKRAARTVVRKTRHAVRDTAAGAWNYVRRGAYSVVRGAARVADRVTRRSGSRSYSARANRWTRKSQSRWTRWENRHHVNRKSWAYKYAGPIVVEIASSLLPGGGGKAGLKALTRLAKTKPWRTVIRKITRGPPTTSPRAISTAKIPTVVFSRGRAPGIAETFDDAVSHGAPTQLTRVTKTQARANRREALRGQPRAPAGQSLDEYPFASSAQGGSGSTVHSVPVAEQNYQGGVLSRFFQNNSVNPGDKFNVRFGA